VLKRPVALAQGFTPYSQFGDWPVYVLSLLIIGWLVFLTWIKNRN
jgi:apolipoprotein N-acyltransferase